MNQPDTKDRLLDAAEELFAEHGYAATSLRAITGQAGANLAAAHYHFGSKLGLFEAAFQRGVEDVNRARLERLDALEAEHGEAVPVEELLRAFLEPVFAHAEARATSAEWWRFRRFLGRVLSETGEHVQALHGVFREVQLRFLPAFARSLPHLESQDLHWRLHLLIGSMCTLLTDPSRLENLSEGRCHATDSAECLRQIVAYAAGGLRAPAAPHGSTTGATRPEGSR